MQAASRARPRRRSARTAGDSAGHAASRAPQNSGGRAGAASSASRCRCCSRLSSSPPAADPPDPGPIDQRPRIAQGRSQATDQRAGLRSVSARPEPSPIADSATDWASAAALTGTMSAAEIEAALLRQLGQDGALADSGAFAAANGWDHMAVVGVIKSLEAAEMVATQVRARRRAAVRRLLRAAACARCTGRCRPSWPAPPLPPAPRTSRTPSTW